MKEEVPKDEKDNKESLTKSFHDKKAIFTYSYQQALPYELLDWKGFERLCYLILLYENKRCVPHFFGSEGESQYGVDLVLQNEMGDFTVYQCKDWKRKYLSEGKFTDFFNKLSDHWIKRQDLPKPSRFILCTSVKIAKKSKTHIAFIKSKDVFQKRYNNDWKQSIQVELWDRTTLDYKLKKLPDIVADMFGKEIALRYCDVEDWLDDIFFPVSDSQKNTCGHLKDYFAKRDRFYIPNKWKVEFFEKIRETNAILIKGFPGTGKTCISLELARRFFFDNTKIGKHPYVYYLTFKSTFTIEEFIRGIKRRLSVPTVFIFDDCQARLKDVNDLKERIPQIIKDSDVYCIYLYRGTLTLEEKGKEIDTFRDFFGEAYLEFKTELHMFKKIIEKLK